MPRPVDMQKRLNEMIKEQEYRRMVEDTDEFKAWRAEFMKKKELNYEDIKL